MVPPLTQEWASAYFQLLFGLFIFSLGVPTLLLQLVDEDIRWVVHNRMKLRHWSVATCLLFAPALLFVWWLHPSQDPFASNDWRTWIAHGIMTVIPFLLATLAPSILSKITREGLIRQLERKAKKDFKKYQSQGNYSSVKNQSLADLIHLGKYGKPGHEKQLVLDALERHVMMVHAAGTYGGDGGDTTIPLLTTPAAQSSEPYNGDEFEAVIRGINTIVAGDGQIGTDENFVLAANILGRIRDGCFNRPNLASSADATLLLVAVLQLGTQATQNASKKTAEHFLELAAKCTSKTVFEFGLAALKTKRYRIAIRALYELELMAQKEEKIPPLEIDDEERLAAIHLLGLSAELSTCGRGARRRAEQTLRWLKGQQKSFEDLLDEASTHYYLWSHFETAEKIEILKLGILVPTHDSTSVAPT